LEILHLASCLWDCLFPDFQIYKQRTCLHYTILRSPSLFSSNFNRTQIPKYYFCFVSSQRSPCFRRPSSKSWLMGQTSKFSLIPRSVASDTKLCMQRILSHEVA
jgi:hypothetical protein